MSKRNLTPEEEKKMFFTFFGYIIGLFSKFLLEELGYVIDYKINGQNIEDIKKLSELNIKEKLDLAIKEERFEDCIILRDIIKAKEDESKKGMLNE
jgi:hypothetical protein